YVMIMMAHFAICRVIFRRIVGAQHVDHPVRHLCDSYLARERGRLEQVALATLMEAWRRDDVPFDFHIEAGAEGVWAALNRTCRELEVVVLSPSAGAYHDRIWHAAVLGFEISQGIVTTVPRINIEHDGARCLSGADTDVRVRPLLPPGFDDALIGGRVMVAVPGARVFPDVALWLSAGAPACLIRGMQGEDRPAPRGKGQGRCKLGIVGKVLREYIKQRSSFAVRLFPWCTVVLRPPGLDPREGRLFVSSAFLPRSCGRLL